MDGTQLLMICTHNVRAYYLHGLCYSEQSGLLETTFSSIFLTLQHIAHLVNYFNNNNNTRKGVWQICSKPTQKTNQAPRNY
jgi:hypothetical protein